MKINYKQLKTFNEKNLHLIPNIQNMDPADIRMMRVVAQIFPFKVNEYVLNELIDWQNPLSDPIFRLTFPNKLMLSNDDYNLIEKVFSAGNHTILQKTIAEIRKRLNPHPSGQMELNVPTLNGHKFQGLQHKYSQTLLVFPAKGQTCHSYCTFCFRWPQFTNDKNLRFSMADRDEYIDYLRAHPEITDILFTGGDPMVMNTANLRSYIEPLLNSKFDNIKNIRIGTKSLSYWPQRYVNQDDSDDLLKFFESIPSYGKQVAIMAHYNHFVEMETDIAKMAIKRLRNSGVNIRSQAPLINRINNYHEIWSNMWREQAKLGIVPYYMFIERDTGAYDYFKVPLAQALEIFKKAYNSVSGLSRTVRGPVMSETNGKVEVLDTITIENKKYFVLRYIQAREVEKVGKIFFADYNESACWFNDLKIIDFKIDGGSNTEMNNVIKNSREALYEAAC